MKPFSLDDPQALDPSRAGAKAAWLARARQAGLPVLPGAVIGVEHATKHLATGYEQLVRHGSGRARMTITARPLPEGLRQDLQTATAGLAAPLVVRSSSGLEGSGLWSGAFTSYLDIGHAELPKALVGCYASAFTPSTIARFEAAGVSPANAAMAVLIQPALEPEFGGMARLDGDEVYVAGVKGSPFPLVQGWDPGVHARVSSEGAIHGAAAADLLGQELVVRVAATLRHAQATVGANHCEWAVHDGTVWLLQVQRFSLPATPQGIAVDPALRREHASSLGRLIRRFPGPLGETLVLPWAIADPGLADLAVPPPAHNPYDALHAAIGQAAAITAEVWSRPKPVAARQAADALRILRSADPGPALKLLRALRAPDRSRATKVLGLLSSVRQGLVGAGAVADEASAWHVDGATARRWLGGTPPPTATRIGFDRWEPFQAALVAAHGAAVSGSPAAPGVAFGRLCAVPDPAAAGSFRPRDVVVAVHPVPGLAALLFDAAAVITTGGSPAAHLFESARSLGIPALCATRIEELVGGDLTELTGAWALAVDGTSGTVHAMEW